MHFFIPGALSSLYETIEFYVPESARGAPHMFGNKIGTELSRNLAHEFKMASQEAGKAVVFNEIWMVFQGDSSPSRLSRDICETDKQSNCNDGECIHIIQIDNFLEGHVAELDSCFGAGEYRLVHITRDPISLLISAYLYHSHSNDCVNACPDLHQMRNANATLGLKMQSQRLLGTTIMEQWESLVRTCDTAMNMQLYSDFVSDQF